MKLTNFVRIHLRIFLLLLIVNFAVSSIVAAQTNRKRTARKTPAKSTNKTTTATAVTPTPTTPKAAVEYGYVSGYNDGYTSGRTDFNTNSAKDFQRSTLYQEANRGYEKTYGELNEYQRGYKSGYEIGYNDGYVGREINARMPANLDPLKTTPATTPAPVMEKAANTSNATKPRIGNKITIPPDTIVRIRLDNEISTKTNHDGDKFTAVIVDPKEYEGLVIEGHIASIKRAGKLTGQTQLALDFDSVSFKDGSSAVFHAQVERVFATEKVKTIDEEGNVQTGSTTKDTTIRSTAGGALGAIIGGIAGGGKGAAIGAILGAGVGAGSVYVQGNKDLIFDPGTELQIRTIGPKR